MLHRGIETEIVTPKRLEESLLFPLEMWKDWTMIEIQNIFRADYLLLPLGKVLFRKTLIVPFFCLLAGI